jgi:hypothetical protein
MTFNGEYIINVKLENFFNGNFLTINYKVLVNILTIVYLIILMVMQIISFQSIHKQILDH